MKNLFLEPFSGLSGDMLNGLLLDLGANIDELTAQLNKLHVDGYHLHVKRIEKSSVYGTDFDVDLIDGEKDNGIAHEFNHTNKNIHNNREEGNECHDEPIVHCHTRNLQDILLLIDKSELSNSVKQHSRNVFIDIAKSEATVHQKKIDEIHFHEVGAIDSIIDVVGFFILWEQLNIYQVYSTPITDGSGTIKVAHGVMPVPVPAVMQLRKGSSLLIQQDFSIHTELVTPTGLAIFKEIKPIFTVPDQQLIEAVGYGFGKRETGKFNALRGSLIDQKYSKKEVHQLNDQILKIETNIDDQTPEQLGYVMDFLFEKGALDVFYTSVLMKKNRSALLLTLLTTPEKKKYSRSYYSNTQAQ